MRGQKVLKHFFLQYRHLPRLHATTSLLCCKAGAGWCWVVALQSANRLPVTLQGVEQEGGTQLAAGQVSRLQHCRAQLPALEVAYAQTSI